MFVCVIDRKQEQICIHTIKENGMACIERIEETGWSTSTVYAVVISLYL